MWTTWRQMFQRWGPHVSLVLPVKNSMPHVKRTIEALRRQTYRNFEVLVQDGGSTDGTVEYLCGVDDLPRIEVASEPDSGVGQAYNRGIARSRGELICLIAADEYLDDDAIEKGVRWFRRHPRAAVVYGGMRLADETGRVTTVFIPPPFDFLRFIHNELFPSTAGFLVRERIGADLYYDESLKTCPDYDFWIRLGSRFGPDELVVIPEPIMTARGDRTSMSYRVESFDAFTRDKLFVLNRYLQSIGDDASTATLRRTASAGILTWAAECVYSLEGHSAEFMKWCRTAAKFDPHSPRLLRLAKRSEAFEIGPAGEFEIQPEPQPLEPAGSTQLIEGGLSLAQTYSQWKDAKVQRGLPMRVTTPTCPWSYSALIPLSISSGVEHTSWFWAKLTVEVLSGQVGFGLLASNDLFNERLVSAHEGRVDVFVRLSQPNAEGIMVRNGPQQRQSIVQIFNATIASARKGDPETDRVRKREARISLQPLVPGARTRSVKEGLSLSRTYSHPAWRGARVEHGRSTRVFTARGPWSYSAVIPLAFSSGVEPAEWFWAKLGVEVLHGQVGIGLLASNDVFNERIVSAGDGRIDVFVRLNQAGAEGVLIRNGYLTKQSIVQIFSATIESSPCAVWQ